MHCAVILVGDELLAGHTRDANAYFLAQRLNALGHRLRHVSIVPDDTRLIQDEVDRMLPSTQLVFVAGGLGPTHDDRTTEAVAALFHRALVAHEPSWERVLARYVHRADVGQAAREAARKMVLVPEGAEVLDNPVGAAPGYVVREGGCAVVVLPGVPAELQGIFEQGIVGELLPRLAPAGLLEVDVELPEAAFAEALGDVAAAYGDLEVGSYPHFGERRVTLRFRGEPERALQAWREFLKLVPEAATSARIVTRAGAGNALPG